MKTLLTIASLFSLCVVAPITAMVLDDEPPYEYDVKRSYIIPSQTYAGHQITVHWQFSHVNRICPGTVIRIIVDALSGARTSYDPESAALYSTVDKKDDFLDRTFMLPSGITKGPKIYRAEIAFACNPLQRWRPLMVRTPDLHFEVIESAP